MIRMKAKKVYYDVKVVADNASASLHQGNLSTVEASEELERSMEARTIPNFIRSQDKRIDFCVMKAGAFINQVLESQLLTDSFGKKDHLLDKR